jgi:IS30 family transposase
LALLGQGLKKSPIGQRYHIYLLNKQGYNQTFIAKSMGRNKSTISRELSRNTGKTQS